MLTAIAILVVAYSITDERYKFRIAVSRIPLPKVFFIITVVVGVGITVVPFWFEIGLPIPAFANNVLYFSTLFTLAFILPITYWIYVAFLRPPLFKKSNASRFARQLFLIISEGNETQIIAAANELRKSVKPILECARRRRTIPDLARGGIKSELTPEARIAYDIILLIGNRQFCRVVATHVPGLAADFFHFISKYGLGSFPILQFSRNIADEMFRSTDAVIHYEDDGFYSGLIGYVKPISREIFGHSQLIEELAANAGSPLDTTWLETGSWTTKSWETYNRVALVFLADHLERYNAHQHSYAVAQIFKTYEHMCSDAYRIEEIGENYWDSIEYQKIRMAIKFIKDVLDLLETQNIARPFKRDAEHRPYVNDDMFDKLARVALKIMFQIASIDSHSSRNWHIQHNTFWSELFWDYGEKRAEKVFRSRLQRLIFDEIKGMGDYLNFFNARILSVCLNMMGLSETREVDRPREYRALKRLVLRLTKANYLKILKEQPKVAETCLSGTISFDSENRRLVKSYLENLDGKTPREFLELDEPKKENKI